MKKLLMLLFVTAGFTILAQAAYAQEWCWTTVPASNGCGCALRYGQGSCNCYTRAGACVQFGACPANCSAGAKLELPQLRKSDPKLYNQMKEALADFRDRHQTLKVYVGCENTAYEWKQMAKLLGTRVEVVLPAKDLIREAEAQHMIAKLK